jgi:hypothetical protein
VAFEVEIVRVEGWPDGGFAPFRRVERAFWLAAQFNIKSTMKTISISPGTTK